MNKKLLIFQAWYIKHYGAVPEQTSNPYNEDGNYTEYQDYLHCKEGFMAGYEAALNPEGVSTVTKDYPKTGRHNF